MKVCGRKFNAVSFFLDAEAKLPCNLEALGEEGLSFSVRRGSDGHGNHTEVRATKV